MHYGVVDSDNKLKHYTPIPLPGPRLPHDMAFTKNYSILNDMPLFWSEELLERDMHVVDFHPEMRSRFAIIPRYGNSEDIQWFEADPTYVLHWTNAYEEGDEVVLDGYYQECPKPGRHESAPPGLERMMAYLSQGLMKPRLHRWRFNLKTGQTVEQRLDDRTLEFGTINPLYNGIKYRYIYNAIPTPDYFTFDGLLKYDLDTGETQEYRFGDQRFGSEASFAPRTNCQHEDDGYLVSIVTDLKENRSEFIMVDAAKVDDGPVCRVILPHRICSGVHATWASANELHASDN